MKRLSLRLRLMLLMICLTTLPVVTVTWIATYNTRASVEKELIGANQSRMKWADQYLNELIDQINAVFYTLQINREVMGEIAGSSGSPDALRDMLSSTFFSNARKIDRLTLYSRSSQKALSVSYADSGTTRTLKAEGTAWSRIVKSPVNMYFKQTSGGITAFHSINRFPDKLLLGGIAVDLNGKVWEEVARILKSEPESYVFLMNDEGELLSGSTPRIASSEVLDLLHTMDLPDNGLVLREGKQYYYFMERIGDGQLTVVKAIPLSTIKASGLPTIRAGFFTGGLFVIASVLLSILFSLRITGPIVSLARTMRMTQVQNFEMKSVERVDEIGLLQRGYNLMMQRIKELIEHEYRHEIEIKNAQLLALQAQINPHFLNNALNLIGGMALVKQAPEIYQITRIMGDMLRYSISAGDQPVPLRDEVAHIRNYLFIQEQRFAGRCTVSLDIDPLALDSRLPKFMLQPVVENAFEHGLQSKQGVWELRIRVRQIRGRVTVLIRDNGAGMAKERLRQLRASLNGKGEGVYPDAAAQSSKRIGLRNVHTRLRLHFGEPYGIRMFSASDRGTVIAMVLPANGDADQGGDPHV